MRMREKMRIEIQRRIKNGEKMRMERADRKKDSLRLFPSSCLLSNGKPDSYSSFSFSCSCSCALVRSFKCAKYVYKRTWSWECTKIVLFFRSNGTRVRERSEKGTKWESRREQSGNLEGNKLGVSKGTKWESRRRE